MPSTFNRNKVIAEFFSEKCMRLLETKGNDYTGNRRNPSMNANFSEVSDMLGYPGVDKYVVWFVYFGKHLTTLFTWLKTRKVESESFESRIADMVNYLLILYSMTVEDEVKRASETAVHRIKDNCERRED